MVLCPLSPNKITFQVPGLLQLLMTVKIFLLLLFLYFKNITITTIVIIINNNDTVWLEFVSFFQKDA